MTINLAQKFVAIAAAASVAQAAQAQTVHQIDMPGNDAFQNAPGVTGCVPEHPNTNMTRQNMEQDHPVLMGRLEGWAKKHSFNIPGTYLKCNYDGDLNRIPPTVTVLATLSP